MITVKASIKWGAATKVVEVNLYNAKDVAGALGITNVAVIIAAQKAGVGVKDAGSMFFTAEDIEVLKVRPGRGRPVGHVKVQAPEVHVEPLNLDEGNYLGEGNNIVDLGGDEEPSHEDKAAAN